MKIENPLTVERAMDEFLDRYANPGTVKANRHGLDYFLLAVGQHREVDTITPQEIQRFFNRLNKTKAKYLNHPRRKPEQEPLRPGTLRKFRRTLAAFFAYLVRVGALDENPMTYVDLSNLREAPDIMPGAEMLLEARVATTTEIAMLIRAAEKQRRKSHFLLALLLFFVDTAARREGVATLRLSHLYLDESKKHIHQNKAVVIEKGKVRPVWFGESTRQVLELYLAERPKVEHDYVFCGRYAPHDPFQRGSMSDVIERLAIAAGIEGPFAPHAIRRWRIDSLKDYTDEKTRGFIAGHSEDSPVTQKRYTFINQGDVERIVMATSWQWNALPSEPEPPPGNVIDFLERKRLKGS